MKITVNLAEKSLAAGGTEFPVSCSVRNELNGRRRLHHPPDVVKTVTAGGEWGKPYMPRPFPPGIWQITGVESTADPSYAPYKIKTNAAQKVQVWALDGKGGYDHPLDEWVDDYGYHLHYAGYSLTTLGCIRIGAADGAAALAAFIKGEWGKGEEVWLEVT